MIKQIFLSGNIYDSLYKAKETLDSKYQDTLEWIMDIVENPKRLKQKECEICNSNEKLEQHHIRGCKHGNETITVCSKCHEQLTSKQRLWDRSWLNPDVENKDVFLERGLIDIYELKYDKTGQEIYKRIAENLTRGFSYE